MESNVHPHCGCVDHSDRGWPAQVQVMHGLLSVAGAHCNPFAMIDEAVEDLAQGGNAPFGSGRVLPVSAEDLDSKSGTRKRTEFAGTGDPAASMDLSVFTHRVGEEVTFVYTAAGNEHFDHFQVNITDQHVLRGEPGMPGPAEHGKPIDLSGLDYWLYCKQIRTRGVIRTQKQIISNF